jgi:hypothetical protein
MKRAGDVLSALFDERLLKKAQGYSVLFNSWAEITVKNGIAAASSHSRIKNLERGILLIEADHPGWIQIIQTKERAILDDFRRRFADLDITGISLMLGRGTPQTGAESPPEKAPAAEETAVPPPAAPLPVMKAGYDAITDESFKESLKRLERSITG